MWKSLQNLNLAFFYMPKFTIRFHLGSRKLVRHYFSWRLVPWAVSVFGFLILGIDLAYFLILASQIFGVIHLNFTHLIIAPLCLIFSVAGSITQIVVFLYSESVTLSFNSWVQLEQRMGKKCVNTVLVICMYVGFGDDLTMRWCEVLPFDLTEILKLFVWSKSK